MENKCLTCQYYEKGMRVCTCTALCGANGEDYSMYKPIDHNADDGKKVEADVVNHPAHYTQGGIECIDCIKATLCENFIGFLIGNVIKYAYRYKDKNGVEDLRKAQWYLERAIKELSENDE